MDDALWDDPLLLHGILCMGYHLWRRYIILHALSIQSIDWNAHALIAAHGECVAWQCFTGEYTTTK